MLKRIRPGQVRLGMFVEGIEGGWANHPFWRKSFLLKRDQDVSKLKASAVDVVIIDTHKGVDIIPSSMRGNANHSSIDNTGLQQALETIEKSKPLLRELFGNARMGGVVSVELAAETVKYIAQTMKANASALIEVTRLKSRDEYTFLHSIAVCAFMFHLARFVSLDEQSASDIGMGGLLHDIGKMRVPLPILNKTGMLTETEMRAVRRHPTMGHTILSRQGNIPAVVLEICLHHHERLDGQGYPKGLSGDEISLPVRISTICDVYDALTTARAYKTAWAPMDAARFMLNQDNYFDKPLLMKFFHSLNI